MTIFHKAVTTVFGLGFAPFAPGTFGTLGAFITIYLLHYCGIDVTTIVLVSSSLILFFLGTWSTDQVTSEWGEDPSKVVVDEYIGYLISILFLPLTLQNLILAFIFFRFFDILKPLGIRWLDKNVKGGLGVMLDDVLAGVYSCICLNILNQFII